jgi:hypothetical protein
VLERRRRSDADEQDGDAHVHQIAPVAPPVAPHQRHQRERHRLA